jgi:class 3 adenylate cyclase
VPRIKRWDTSDLASFPTEYQETGASVSLQRIDFRVGIHIGDVVEESDGDLMGDGVNISARWEGIADPGGIWKMLTAKFAARCDRLGVSLGHRRRMLRAIRELDASPIVAVTERQASARTAPEPALKDTAERRQVTVMFSDLVWPLDDDPFRGG